MDTQNNQSIKHAFRCLKCGIKATVCINKIRPVKRDANGLTRYKTEGEEKLDGFDKEFSLWWTL